MRILTCIVPLLVMVTPFAGTVGQPRPNDAVDRETAARVNALWAQLHFDKDDPRDVKRHYAELKALTDRIRAEVDKYIQTAVGPQEASERILARLRTVLTHRPNPKYGDLPLATLTNLRAGPALLVAYTIVRPPHDDAATIRGYRAGSTNFELVATTGDDFEGYGMFKAVLHSPIPGELWLLAWGQAHTFNGTKVRLRLYAFDGAIFRTVWRPDDMFNASVRLTDFGFAIDHHVQREPYELHDEYTLTPDGPIKTATDDVIR